MAESSFWRTEIWHPVSVHFPIVLLLLATVLRVASLGAKGDRKPLWKTQSGILLLLGCAAAWISIYTGNLADGIVSRKICDPTVLKDHELAANNLAYLFSTALVLDLITFFKSFKKRVLNLIGYLVLLLMLCGSAFLVYAGHLGAELVYEQGAGVNMPPSDCSGFK